MLLTASFGKCLLKLKEKLAFSEDRISNIKDSFPFPFIPCLPGISELSIFNFGGSP